MYDQRLPSRKIYLSFKEMKNIKTAYSVLTMNSFYNKYDILLKNSEVTTQKVRLRGISLQPQWLANLN